jgi:hypothetical protein
MKRFLFVSRSLCRIQQKPTNLRGSSVRYLSTAENNSNGGDNSKVNVKDVSAGLPDFIEEWDRNKFRKVGYGLTALTLASSLNTFMIFEEHTILFTAGLGALTGNYIYIYIYIYDDYNYCYFLLGYFRLQNICLEYVPS